MNRFDLASVFGLFVLVGGLASCSQDQKTTDTYKSPPPVIVTSKGQQNFLQWERESDKTLDLQDAFDVSAGRPSRTEVLAHCMRDKTSFSGKFTVNGLRPVRIFQVVPQDVLFDDLNKVPVTCDWEVSLSNEVGSRHIIRLPTSPLSDRAADEVILENSGDREKIKLVQILKTNDVKIRFRNSEAASAEILCRDVTFDALPFERVLELSQFDLRRPVFRAGRSEADVAQTPLQPCRIVVNEAGQIWQISALTMIHLPRQPLEVRVTKTFAVPWGAGFIFFINNTVGLADLAIRNPSLVARHVQIPRNLMMKLDAIIANINGAADYRRSTMTLPWLSLQMLEAFPIVKEEPSGWVIVIPPQATFHLRVNYRDQYGGCFRDSNRFTGFAIHPAPLNLNELMPNGEVIQSTEIALPEVWQNMTPEEFQSTPLMGRRCF